MTQFLIFLLLADSAWIAYGLCRKRNMWRWIALYWIILTIKNLVDWIGG